MSERMITNESVFRAQNGDEEALELILSTYKNFIYMNSRNYFLQGADQEDLIQEGMIGLIKAIRAFKGDKNASFKTFATLCIKRQLITAIKVYNTQKNRVLNEANRNYIEGEDGKELIYEKAITLNPAHNPEEMLLSMERIKDLDRYSQEHFSKIEREVFVLLAKGYTYRGIAELTGKPLKLIDNAIQRIKRKSQEWNNSY